MTQTTQIDCSHIDAVHVRKIVPVPELTLASIAGDEHFSGFIHVLAGAIERRRRQPAHASH